MITKAFMTSLTHVLSRSAAIGVLLVAAACSGGGAPTEVNPVTTPPTAGDDYTGPAPANADVQAFRLALWQNIKPSNRCGGCHNAGGQSPQFARSDDVNLAYQAAVALVNLTDPSASRLVTKVGSGHNCWLAANSACADTMVVWIRNWANSVAAGGKTIQLQEPVIKEVGSSRSFPDSSASYGSTIYPLVTGAGKCVNCHSPNSATPQSPYFAHANDVDAAYSGARTKINLSDDETSTVATALSRFVVRLRDESHNCWTNSCANDAAAMYAQVRAFVTGIPVTQVDPSLVVSKALTLYDGTVAAGGNRFETNQIALYEFKTGEGSVAYDTSGVEPAANLNISGGVEWVGGWGLNVKQGGKAQGTTTGSAKLANMIKSTGEFTIEAWVAPANVVQEDAYIVSYSAGNTARNATLAQREYQYQAMTRSDKTDANGTPALLTNAADEDAQASLQHVVLTYDPVNGQRLFVNGRPTGDVDTRGGGSISDWDNSFALVLGNETSGQRQWTGVMRLIAVHNRALTATQVEQNFTAGVGERYFLLFNVSELVNLNKTYVMFEASQYDSYAYLFNKPTLISLDPAVQPNNLQIKGIRIGVNGAEARVGQAYIPLNATIGGTAYTAASGQLMSDTGTVIGLQKGPEDDLFFLSFEQIASHTHTPDDLPSAVAADPLSNTDPLGLESDVGLRTFDEINASMSAMTGVAITNTDVAATFTLVKQGLPSVESITTFASAHQVALAQLATEYCNVLANDEGGTPLATFFPGLAVNQPAATYFNNQPNRDLLINPLISRLVGANISTQPDATAVRTELNGLIGKLTACGGSCSANRSRDVVKAACAAVLSSAAMTIQ